MVPGWRMAITRAFTCMEIRTVCRWVREWLVRARQVLAVAALRRGVVVGREGVVMVAVV